MAVTLRSVIVVVVTTADRPEQGAHDVHHLHPLDELP